MDSVPYDSVPYDIVLGNKKLRKRKMKGRHWWLWCLPFQATVMDAEEVVGQLPAGNSEIIPLPALLACTSSFPFKMSIS